MKQFTETWQQVANKWKNGDIVWSAELGGIGPGYEQAIQIALFEILVMFLNKDLPSTYDDYVRLTVPLIYKLDKTCRFSGAQILEAQQVAWQFMKFGYAEMMNKLDDDRKIMVDKSFPHVPSNLE